PARRAAAPNGQRKISRCPRPPAWKAWSQECEARRSRTGANPTGKKKPRFGFSGCGPVGRVGSEKGDSAWGRASEESRSTGGPGEREIEFVSWALRAPRLAWPVPPGAKF